MKTYIGIGLLILLGSGHSILAQAQPTTISNRSATTKAAPELVREEEPAVPKMQTLLIQEGKVFINGEAQSELPKDLDLDGVTLKYDFFGGFIPVFEINGKNFTIDKGKLVGYDKQFKTEQDFGSFMEQQAAQYNQVRRNLQPLESNSNTLNLKDDAPDLFSRIRKEQWLEYETEQLAVKIRMTPEGAARAQMTRELRQKLNVIFDLRQQNLEEEIRQLNNQLILLRGRLRDKELEKERIIEARLQELIRGQ